MFQISQCLRSKQLCDWWSAASAYIMHLYRSNKEGIVIAKPASRGQTYTYTSQTNPSPLHPQHFQQSDFQERYITPLMESHLRTNPTGGKKKSSVFLGTEKQARKEQIRYVCEESWGGYRTFQSSLFLLRMSLRRVPTLINDSAVICKRENRTTNSSRLCVCSLWPHQHSFLVRQLTWQTI